MINIVTECYYVYICNMYRGTVIHLHYIHSLLLLCFILKMTFFVMYIFIIYV